MRLQKRMRKVWESNKYIIFVTAILSLVHTYFKMYQNVYIKIQLNVCFSTFNRAAEISIKLLNLNANWSTQYTKI